MNQGETHDWKRRWGLDAFLFLCLVQEPNAEKEETHRCAGFACGFACHWGLPGAPAQNLWAFSEDSPSQSAGNKHCAECVVIHICWRLCQPCLKFLLRTTLVLELTSILDQVDQLDSNCCTTGQVNYGKICKLSWPMRRVDMVIKAIVWCLEKGRSIVCLRLTIGIQGQSCPRRSIQWIWRIAQQKARTTFVCIVYMLSFHSILILQQLLQLGPGLRESSDFLKKYQLILW